MVRERDEVKCITIVCIMSIIMDENSCSEREVSLIKFCTLCVYLPIESSTVLIIAIEKSFKEKGKGRF